MIRALVIAVVMVGCGPARLPGAPSPGQACAGDAPVCMTASSVGTCVNSKWAEWSCVDSCSNSTDPRCEEVQPTKAGDECPPDSIDGGAVKCVESDAGMSRTILRCVQGKAAEESCPGGCQPATGGIRGFYCLQ